VILELGDRVHGTRCDAAEHEELPDEVVARLRADEQPVHGEIGLGVSRFTRVAADVVEEQPGE
jgi:hypothetical protein